MYIINLLSNDRATIKNTKGLSFTGLIHYSTDKTNNYVKIITTTCIGVICWEIYGNYVTRLRDVKIDNARICHYNLDISIIFVTCIVDEKFKLLIISLDGDFLNDIKINSTSADSKIFTSSNMKNIAIVNTDKLTILSY